MRLALAAAVLATALITGCGGDDAPRADDTALEPGQDATETTDGGGGGGSGRCPSGAFPDEHRGQPATLRSDDPPPGYYLWWDRFGWHLRVIDADAAPERPSYTGRILANAEGTSAKAIDDAGPVAIDGDGSPSVTFDIRGSAEPSGVDFIVRCTATELRIELSRSDGSAVDPAVVRVGSNGNAVENPVQSRRVA